MPTKCNNPQYRGLLPRTPTWKSGETTSIRIPKKLKEQVLAFARQLDEQYQQESQ
jgi:hypothetical protein